MMPNQQLNLFPSSNYERVQSFHAKFKVPAAKAPALLAEDVLSFRVGFINEELDELIAAHNAADMVGCLDALTDLLYVVYGTADMMGLPIDAAFQIVHRANMRKERVASADQSKRGHTFDVRKPEGWEPPEPQLKALLVAAGYKMANGTNLP